MEHRVGRVRAGDLGPFLAKPADRRDDQIDLLPAERSALAGMGVEPGHRQARPLDPEQPPKRPDSGPAALDDELRGQTLGHVPERDMGRDRDRAQGRACEHHRHHVLGDSAALGDELGLAGMGEADGVELGL